MSSASAALVLFWTLLTLSTSAQKRAMTIAEFRELNNGTSIDSSYRSAMNSDPAKAVFGDRQQEFHLAWQELLRDMGAYLNANGFKWPREVRCTTRIYFSSDGRVDQFLYSFKEGDLGVQERQRFEDLLNDFLAIHDLPLQADERFSQCGPILFRPAEKQPQPPTP